MNTNSLALTVMTIIAFVMTTESQVWNTTIDNESAKALAESFEAQYEDEMEEIGTDTVAFKKEIKGSIKYRFFSPATIDKNKKYPLVLFLHGAGERGTDNESHMGQGALMWALKVNQSKYPCFIIAPQCPPGKQWVNTPWENGSYKLADIKISNELQTVLQILNEKISTNPIDQDRIYITGLSMGGFGTWDMLMRNPTMFAAAIPICGGASPTDASLVKQIPIKTFHGKSDGVVPYEGTYQMTDAIYSAGGRSIAMTTYLNGSHIIWGHAYSTPGIVDWLFAQKRGVLVSISDKDILKVSHLKPPQNNHNSIVYSLSGKTLNIFPLSNKHSGSILIINQKKTHNFIRH